MEPHERIRYTFYDLLRKLLISIGHDFLQKDGFKPNLITYFMYGLNTLGLISCIYTVMWYDISTGLNSIGYGAINIQLVAKILLMRYWQLMSSIINRIIAIYEVNADTKSPKRALLLQNMSWIGELMMICGIAVYIFGELVHYTNPIYGYFWQNEFKALFPLYIPFINEKTAVGFTILMLIQSVEALMAAIASGCADFPFMILVLNVWIFSTIFKDTVNELNDILRKENVDAPLTKTKFRSIFKMYYDNWVLIDDIDTISFVCNFVVIVGAAVASAVELFTCMTIGFVPAGLLALLFLIQIFGFCGIGTIIEFCNDQMTDSLINCDWYLLPIDEQIKFKFLVMHVNLGKTLTLGGIRPLSMDTCVTIFRKIYSYAMILHRLIN